MTKPIPDGFNTITPHIVVQDATKAIDLYKNAFGAVEAFRLPDDAGKLSHAEIRIGDAAILLSDEYPEITILSPHTIGGSPVMIVLDVPDVDLRCGRTRCHERQQAGCLLFDG